MMKIFILTLLLSFVTVSSAWCDPYKEGPPGLITVTYNERAELVDTDITNVSGKSSTMMVTVDIVVDGIREKCIIKNPAIIEVKYGNGAYYIQPTRMIFVPGKVACAEMTQRRGG